MSPHTNCHAPRTSLSGRIQIGHNSGLLSYCEYKASQMGGQAECCVRADTEERTHIGKNGNLISPDFPDLTWLHLTFLDSPIIKYLYMNKRPWHTGVLRLVLLVYRGSPSDMPSLCYHTPDRLIHFLSRKKMFNQALYNFHIWIFTTIWFPVRARKINEKSKQNRSRDVSKYLGNHLP